jgi:hypothetical protein
MTIAETVGTYVWRSKTAVTKLDSAYGGVLEPSAPPVIADRRKTAKFKLPLQYWCYKRGTCDFNHTIAITDNLQLVPLYYLVVRGPFCYGTDLCLEHARIISV